VRFLKSEEICDGEEAGPDPRAVADGAAALVVAAALIAGLRRRRIDTVAIPSRVPNGSDLESEHTTGADQLMK